MIMVVALMTPLVGTEPVSSWWEAEHRRMLKHGSITGYECHCPSEGFHRYVLKNSSMSASHHELTGSAPTADIMRVTLVVMVHGMGPKWELARSSRVSTEGPESVCNGPFW